MDTSCDLDVRNILMIMSKIYLPTLVIVTKASFADVVKFIITFGEKYGQKVISNLTLKKKNEKPTQTQTLMLRKVAHV